MADDRYILKPLTNADGKRGYRLEIDEFLADNEMTNLFLIALAKLQQDSLRQWNGKPDWLTYYSLAGVHGHPREDWNGYPNKGSEYGYCHHSMNTFPTWHRPYLLLFESAVHEEMVEQAKAYLDEKQRKIYLDAAARFRFPYWDLIMPRKEETNSDPTTIWGCPEIFKAKDVYVKLPGDDPAKDEKGFSKMENPLASFTFPNDQERRQHPERKKLVMPSSFNKARTARTPNSNSKNENDHSAFNLTIQQNAADFATKLWQMLNPDQKEESLDQEKVEIMINEERSWESFANDRNFTDTIRDHKYATVSLESWHNSLHAMIGTGKDGCAGHMGHPAYAAFDPIFWMHHNNIERLFALFQALYPSKYTNAQDSEQALYPFMTGRGRDCYASKDDLVKSYWGAGYAIPGDKKLDPPTVREKVKVYLTDTYYWATNKKPLSGSLPRWPKKLTGSWALHGQNAVAPVAPALQLTAIALKAGVPELVARKVLLQAESPAAQIKDKVIEASKVMELVHAVDSSLPDGALTGPPSISNPPIQQTWNAHIKVRKFAFHGSFSIHLFIGYVKDDQPERYMTKKNEAGFTGVFASGFDSGCANCAKNQEDDILVEDVVPLTTILYDYLDASEGSETLIRDGEIKTIRDLETDRVVPFLTEHLQWRMIDLESTLLVGQEQQAGLEITVTSRQFLAPAQVNPMGVYGPYTPHPEITRTKPGGFGYTY